MSLNRLLFDSFDALIDSPTRSLDFGFFWAILIVGYRDLVGKCGMFFD